MCQPKIIKLGFGNFAKYYKLEDFLLHIFFNALDKETQEKFMIEFEVDKHGNRRYSPEWAG